MAQSGHENKARLLLFNGADMKLCYKNRNRPLLVACYKGYEITAKLLLVNGADRNLCNKGGLSPLYVECYNELKSTQIIYWSMALFMNLWYKNRTIHADMNLCYKGGLNPLF